MALMPFLMAGDPDLSVTAEVLLSLQTAGADMVELGMPYSDPLADGPVIQAAAARALAAGTTPKKVLEMLSSLRGQLSIPVSGKGWTLSFWWHRPPQQSGWGGSLKAVGDSPI